MLGNGRSRSCASNTAYLPTVVENAIVVRETTEKTQTTMITRTVENELRSRNFKTALASSNTDALIVREVLVSR